MFRLLTLLSVVLVGAAAPGRTAAPPAQPRFQVIVNADNAAQALSRERLAQVFLKKQRRWDSGQPVDPVDQHAASSTRALFSQEVLGRPVAAVRAYWQQRLFSGRDVPPPERESDEQVVEYVRKHPGAVGYVRDGVDVRAVKVLRITE